MKPRYFDESMLDFASFFAVWFCDSYLDASVCCVNLLCVTTKRISFPNFLKMDELLQGKLMTTCLR